MSLADTLSTQITVMLKLMSLFYHSGSWLGLKFLTIKYEGELVEFIDELSQHTIKSEYLKAVGII